MALRPLSAVQEDYLEAIAELAGSREAVRSRDIASRVGVHKSTVTAALRALSARGLVRYSPYAAAELTAAGRKAAAVVRRRHLLLRRFLAEVLGMGAAEADSTACRLEHAVDSDVLDRLVRLGEFLGSSADWRAWAGRPAGAAEGTDPS